MSEETSSKMIVTIEAVKALAWPFVALVFLTLFYSPVHQLASNFADRMQDIHSFKLGELELNVRESDLPVPSNETAKALKSFNETMFAELLALSDGSGPCFPGENLSSDPRYVALEKLDDLNQITFVPEKQTDDWCDNPHTTTLTDSGKETRSFIVELVSTQMGTN